MIVPPPSAEKPVPVVVEMSSPAPPVGLKLIVPPALPTSSVTALFAPVVSAIVGLLKLIVAAGIVADLHAAFRSR